MIDSTSASASLSRTAAVAQRWLACAGALLAGAAVALSAYAAHASAGAGQAGLYTAAAMAFGHGVALAALSRAPRRRLAVLALATMLLGSLLFCGGLVVAELAGMHARVAPFGGVLLIVAWLAYAIDALRN